MTCRLARPESSVYPDEEDDFVMELSPTPTVGSLENEINPVSEQSENSREVNGLANTEEQQNGGSSDVCNEGQVKVRLRTDERCAEIGPEHDTAGHRIDVEVKIDQGEDTTGELSNRLSAAQFFGGWFTEDDEEGPEDVICDLFADTNHTVQLDYFLSELRRTGLRDDDPRLEETMAALLTLKRQNHSGVASEEQFKQCISKNIVMLSRAFGSEFRIKDFQKFSSDIEDIFELCKAFKQGTNAQYIPQLAKRDSDLWGVSVCSVDGQRISFGDARVPFTIQSAIKPLAYALAATELGSETLHRFVGFEPSGRSFNEITLDSKNRPHNPMINSGAILVSSLLKPNSSSCERFEFVYEKFKKLCGGIGHFGFNNSVYLSEKGTAWRNLALAYFMKESNCFPPHTNIQESLELYFQICSLELNCESLSIVAGALANGGVCPVTDERLLQPEVVRDTLSIMFSCGMYDYSGQFAFEVGLPAKSAVSGAVLLVVPNVCGIACFAPPLDKCGNSVKGVHFCTKLVQKFGFHNFMTSQVSNSREASDQPTVVTILFAAQRGDMSAFRRFYLQGVDFNNIRDYDNRRALHVAAAEGHLDVVKFLVEKGHADKNVKDRWGNTPYSEAESFGHMGVARYLKNYTRRKSLAAPSSDQLSRLLQIAQSAPTSTDDGYSSNEGNIPRSLLARRPSSGTYKLFSESF